MFKTLCTSSPTSSVECNMWEKQGTMIRFYQHKYNISNKEHRFQSFSTSLHMGGWRWGQGSWRVTHTGQGDKDERKGIGSIVWAHSNRWAWTRKTTPWDEEEKGQATEGELTSFLDLTFKTLTLRPTRSPVTNPNPSLKPHSNLNPNLTFDPDPNSTLILTLNLNLTDPWLLTWPLLWT